MKKQLTVGLFSKFFRGLISTPYLSVVPPLEPFISRKQASSLSEYLKRVE